VVRLTPTRAPKLKFVNGDSFALLQVFWRRSPIKESPTVGTNIFLLCNEPSVPGLVPQRPTPATAAGPQLVRTLRLQDYVCFRSGRWRVFPFWNRIRLGNFLQFPKGHLCRTEQKRVSFQATVINGVRAALTATHSKRFACGRFGLLTNLSLNNKKKPNNKQKKSNAKNTQPPKRYTRLVHQKAYLDSTPKYHTTHTQNTTSTYYYKIIYFFFTTNSPF